MYGGSSFIIQHIVHVGEFITSDVPFVLFEQTDVYFYASL